MQEEIFKRRVDSVLLSQKEGRFEESNLKCRLLRQELFEAAAIEPEQLGFLRLLEVESLFGAGQYAEAWAVFNARERVPFFLGNSAQSRMLYLGMELSFRLSDPLSMIGFGRLFLRWWRNEEGTRIKIFRTLCNYLEIIARPDLNFVFAKELLSLAHIHKRQDLLFYSFGQLAFCYRQKKLYSIHNFLSRELAAFLANIKESMPEMEQLFEELQVDVTAFSLPEDIENCEAMYLDPHYVCPQTSQGILHYAVLQSDKPLLFRGLSMAADIDLVDKFYRTPLHWAAMQAKIELLAPLLEAGAQTELKDINGFTPLLYARMLIDGENIVQLLLASGAETL